MNLKINKTKYLENLQISVNKNTLNQLHIYMYPLSFRFYFHTEYWVQFPVLYGKFLLVIYFIYSSVYMSVLISQLTSW